MAAMTLPARGSPVAKEIDERTASKITSGLRRMIKKRINQPRCRSCATSFGSRRACSRVGLALLRGQLKPSAKSEATHPRLSLPHRGQPGRRECYVALPSQGFETHLEQEESL